MDYSHLNIWATRWAPRACRRACRATPDHAIFPASTPRPSTATTTRSSSRCPSSPARWARPRSPKNWEHFAVGAAICRHHLRLRRERLRHRPGLELDTQGQGHEVARHGPPRRDLRRYHEALRRHHRADERRGHPLRRGRVRGRQAGRRDHRAEVGPGRQVHRRRDQGRLAWSAPSSCRSAATSSPPTRPTRSTRPPSRTARIKEFERHSPARLRRRGGLHAARSSACASWAPSASR